MNLSRFDPVTEESLPPVSSIDVEPDDPEPAVRAGYQGMEYELDAVERRLPDAPRRRRDQPQPRADRAEDLMRPRSGRRERGLSVPGVMDWNDDGAWDDSYGVDVVEEF